ncbi:MAG: U32 family peptidase [Oscillospiraceae bacterium]|nr:U32 family peptidase [Oscillospiraceae bacterium]
MLRAVLRCGADAVYLGGAAFNARGAAANFRTKEELREAFALCVAYHVKVYFALNTLLFDPEMEAALALAETAAAFGADAVIVQDLGLLRLLRERFPTLPLHASTQCSVQTAAGMALLRRLGVTRVVAPRECSAAELQTLCDTAPVELEVFVHGALCMSVSGQCRMSTVMGGGERSANRGACAQPCRLPFCAGDRRQKDETAALSLKDLSLLELCDTPPLNRVASFKIEGRQKRPEYAAAAVSALYAKLHGLPAPVTAKELRQAFSRTGFTQGYYAAERGAAMFGTRRREDAASPALLGRLAALYEKDRPCVPLRLQFCGTVGEPARLRAWSGERYAEVDGETVQMAQSAPLSPSDIARQLRKLGGSPYRLDELTMDWQTGAFLPLGAVSALRRAALAALNAKSLAHRSIAGASVPAGLPRRAQTPQIYVRAQDYRQLPDALPGAAKLFLPCETPPEILRAWMARLPVAVTIPAGIFEAGADILAQLRQAAACGIAEAITQTPDGIAFALESGLRPIAGEGMNLCNRAALEVAASWGADQAVISPECARVPQASVNEAAAPMQIGALAYGRLSLMLCRCCPVRAARGCAACQNCAELTDRKGVRFPVRCRMDCAEIFNSRPIWLADRLPALRRRPLDFWLLSFTIEAPARCAAVLSAYRSGGAPPSVFTRGMLHV